MTDTIEQTNEQFRCEVDGNIAVIHLQEKAFEIISEVAPGNNYISLLEAVGKNPDICGLIQINKQKYQGDVAFRQFLEKHLGGYNVSEHQLAAHMTRYITIGSRLINAFAHFKKPMVAGVGGKVTLEYIGLVMPFDFRIAGSDTEAIFPNVRMGFPPSGQLSYQLQKVIGSAKATEILLSGESLTASQLLELGLVSKVVDSSNLEIECMDTIRKVCAQPASALMATRQMMQSDMKAFQEFVGNSKSIIMPVLVGHLKK